MTIDHIGYWMSHKEMVLFEITCEHIVEFEFFFHYRYQWKKSSLLLWLGSSHNQGINNSSDLTWKPFMRRYGYWNSTLFTWNSQSVERGEIWESINLLDTKCQIQKFQNGMSTIYALNLFENLVLFYYLFTNFL